MQRLEAQFSVYAALLGHVYDDRECCARVAARAFPLSRPAAPPTCSPHHENVHVSTTPTPTPTSTSALAEEALRLYQQLQEADPDRCSLHDAACRLAGRADGAPSSAVALGVTAACSALAARCPFAPPQQQSLAALHLFQSGEAALAQSVALRAAGLAMALRLSPESQGEAFVHLAHITAGIFARQAEQGGTAGGVLVEVRMWGGG